MSNFNKKLQDMQESMAYTQEKKQEKLSLQSPGVGLNKTKTLN